MKSLVKITAIAVLITTACSTEQPTDSAEIADEQAAISADADAVTSEADSLAAEEESLRTYLIGTWSYENHCTNDFNVQYGDDGEIYDAGSIGTWELKGSTVTQIMTGEYLDPTDEDPVIFDTPQTLSYEVAMVDSDNAMITTDDGRKVPLLRCDNKD